MSPHRRILAIGAKNAEPITIVIATSAAMKITLLGMLRRRRYLPPETTA
jgi:hypothetical protein